MKVTDLDTKVQTLDLRITESEKSCDFINKESEDQKTQIMGVKTDCSKQDNQCKSLEEELRNLKILNKAMESKLVDQEMRFMRDNLIFFGIPESGSDAAEDCKSLVKQVCADHLKLQNLSFDRVHRIGAKATGKARRIVAKFHYHKERESVRKMSYECSEALKSINIGIGVQWPKEVRETRKQIYPIMEREKNKGNTVKFVGDKLFINGRPFIPNHDNDVTKWNSKFYPGTLMVSKKRL